MLNTKLATRRKAALTLALVGALGAAGLGALAACEGPEGPQGPAGANGANGAVGPMGPMGATGPAGAPGAQGAVGPQGPAGTTGPQGPAGPEGSPGVVKSFLTSTQQHNQQIAIPAGAWFTPASCRTPDHVASAGEIALVQSTLVLRFSSTFDVDVTTGHWDNGGAYQPTENGLFVAGPDIVVTTYARMALSAGVTYQFGPAIRSGAGTLTRYSCHVGYQIVRA